MQVNESVLIPEYAARVVTTNNRYSPTVGQFSTILASDVLDST